MLNNNTKELSKNIDSYFDNPTPTNTKVKKDVKLWEGIGVSDVTGAQPIVTEQRYEDYDRLLGDKGKIDPIYGDIDEKRAQAQSNIGKLSMMLPRIGNKIVNEVVKIPGEIYGLGEWALKGFDVNEFADAMDNAWVRGVQEKSDLINEELLPVYKRREIEEGGLFRQVISPEFWATEGADGIGFLVSMMVPGQALKLLKFGEGVSKLGKLSKLITGAKTGEKVTDVANTLGATFLNTGIESMAEGSETMKNLEDSMKQNFYQQKLQELTSGNQYDPQEASDIATQLSEEYINNPEIKDKISKAGYNTFMKNLAILPLGNLMDQVMLFKGFDSFANKGVISKRLAATGEEAVEKGLNKIERLTNKQIRNRVLGEAGIGVLKEGFYEEGLQYAASELEKNKVIDPENAGDLLSTYIDGLSDTDMQKSIFLGSVLGGGMQAVGGYQNAKREDEYLFGSPEKTPSKLGKFLGRKDSQAKEGVLDIFKNNFTNRYRTVEDLYEKEVVDGKERIVFDEKGEPKFSMEKIAKFGTDILDDIDDKEKLKEYADTGNKEAFEFVKNKRDFKYMLPFLREEGGYELLQQHIEELAQKDLEELSEQVHDADTTVGQIKEDLLKKAEYINNIVKKSGKVIDRLYTREPNNAKYDNNFIKNLEDSYISTEFFLNYLDKSIARNKTNASSLITKPSVTTPVEVDTLKKGDVINYDGQNRIVASNKDNVLTTLNLQGERKDYNTADILEVNKYTDILQPDRKELANNLSTIHNNTLEKEYLIKNMENLFTKEGQQKAYDEYIKFVKGIEKKVETVPVEEVKTKVTEAVNKEDIIEAQTELNKVKTEVIESEDLSDNNKKTIVKEITDVERELDEQKVIEETAKKLKGKFKSPEPVSTEPKVEKISEVEDIEAKKADIERRTQEDVKNIVKNRQEIEYETTIYDQTADGNKRKVRGKSPIIDLAGRKVVVLNVNGMNVPFYLSTGHGGKADVTSGKWYPIFGIAQDGWMNKLSGKEINNYYDSKILKLLSEELDTQIGDIRNDNSIPKAGISGSHIDFINRDLTPTENGLSTTRDAINKNIENVKNKISAKYDAELEALENKIPEQPFGKTLEETHESKEGPITYDGERLENVNKEDELEYTEQEDLAESEFKTTGVNIAYLASEYTTTSGKLSTKITKEGDIVETDFTQSLPSLPNEYAPGTEIVMYLIEDENNEYYQKYKDDVNMAPIAIQTRTDYGAGKQPFLYLHTMDWITPLRVAEDYIEDVKRDTKAIREFLFKQKQPVITTITDKSHGFVFKPGRNVKQHKQFTLREVIGNDTRPVLALGTASNNMETDSSIDIINGHKAMSGIPYLILPTANNSNAGIWLKQLPIKDNPNKDKYFKTVTRILEEYVKDGKSLGMYSIEQLREEVGKYFHVNTNRFAKEVKDKENRDFIFHLQQTTSGQLQVALIDNNGAIENYYFVKDNATKEYGWVVAKGNKKTTVSNMAGRLAERIPNKYPNITKNGIKSDDKFDVLELDSENKLVRVKKNYIDFLSENRVVTTSVQPRIVKGQRVYFGQPNIKININTNSYTVIEKKSNNEVVIPIADSGIIPNFDEFLKEMIEIKTKFTKEDMEEAEKIMKHCKGLGKGLGKGKVIKRN